MWSFEIETLEGIRKTGKIEQLGDDWNYKNLQSNRNYSSIINSRVKLIWKKPIFVFIFLNGDDLLLVYLLFLLSKLCWSKV